MEQRFKNQKSLLDQDKLASLSFLVIGAGAIGSYFVTTLSKMGAKDITVYDYDKIEEHNISNQIYPLSSVGSPKIEILKRMASSFGDCQIIEKNQKWIKGISDEYDVVVSAVDNMDVRKEIWDWYSRMNCVKFCLDGRMSAQLYKVYGIDMSNNEAKKFYETTLYPQSEASEEPCGQKSIIYTVLQVGGQMLSQVKRWIMKDYRPTEVVYDCLEDQATKKYFMERPMEVIEAPEEEVINA